MLVAHRRKMSSVASKFHTLELCCCQHTKLHQSCFLNHVFASFICRRKSKTWPLRLNNIESKRGGLISSWRPFLLKILLNLLACHSKCLTHTLMPAKTWAKPKQRKTFGHSHYAISLQAARVRCTKHQAPRWFNFDSICTFCCVIISLNVHLESTATWLKNEHWNITDGKKPTRFFSLSDSLMSKACLWFFAAISCKNRLFYSCF